MIRDHQDAIIDQLLREILGGDRPRDMSARVLAQARIIDRFRRRKWILSGLAVAASVALVAGLFLLWPQSYPAPHAYGMVVVDGAAFEPGVPLVTGDTPGFVSLGNYVEISTQPNTQITIGGTRFREKVFLDKGEVDVTVLKKRGEFDVVVGPATVHVTGTRFNVKVTDESTLTARVKKMVVNVKEGGVQVRGAPLGGPADVPLLLAAGETREFVLSTAPRLLPLRPGAGVVAATQGARGANRGALATRIAEGLTARGSGQYVPGNTTVVRPPQTTAGPSPAQGVRFISTPGNARRSGILRHSGDLYFLETPEGNFFMFQKAAVSTAHPNWLTMTLGQSTIVSWTNGEVTNVAQ